jgi:hypothetical protein
VLAKRGPIFNVTGWRGKHAGTYLVISSYCIRPISGQRNKQVHTKSMNVRLLRTECHVVTHHWRAECHIVTHHWRAECHAVTRGQRLPLLFFETRMLPPVRLQSTSFFFFSVPPICSWSSSTTTVPGNQVRLSKVLRPSNNSFYSFALACRQQAKAPVTIRASVAIVSARSFVVWDHGSERQVRPRRRLWVTHIHNIRNH